MLSMLAGTADMRFAVVIHGPEAIDTGLFQRLLSVLEREGETVALMSGCTGVAAVVDAELEGIVDISSRNLPSSALKEMNEAFDVLVLVNSAKSRETAVRLGLMIYSKARERLTKPFLQVDREIVIDWNGLSGDIASNVASQLSLETLAAAESVGVGNEKGRWRRIGGVVPGESVWVNGVVVGRATERDVRIGRDDEGMLIAMGMTIKPEGVRRLGPYDPFHAGVRSGVVRRTRTRPRSLRGKGRRGAYLIDHSAEESIYRCREAGLVVTVGDDTSTITGNILFRFGVPIVGITDGDEDGICPERLLAEGSILLRFRQTFDDLVGRRTREIIFGGGDFLDSHISPEEMAKRIREIAPEVFLSEIAFDRVEGIERTLKGDQRT